MKKTRWYLDRCEHSKFTVNHIWKEVKYGLALWYVKSDNGWRDAMWRQSKLSEPVFRRKKDPRFREITEEEVFATLL